MLSTWVTIDIPASQNDGNRHIILSSGVSANMRASSDEWRAIDQ